VADSEELGVVSAEHEDSGAMASDELFAIGSAELDEAFSASEPEFMTSEEDDASRVSLRELEYVAPSSLLAGAGSHCSGMSTLEDESEEHAVSAATAAPVKNTPSLVFVNRMF